ncbi:MAG: hypothetical protein ABSB15_28290, partial [Bryobacteraceae bacterium]
METTATGTGLDQAAGIVKGILRGMLRRGLPGNVDQDDLRQAGVVAVFLSGVEGPDSLVAKVARDAMRDYLRKKFRENRTFTSLDETADGGRGSKGKAAKDPF